MNFLTTSNRQYLPNEKRLLFEHRDRISRFKSKIVISIGTCFFIVVGLILFPQIIFKTAPLVAPIYGTYKPDPILKEAYVIKTITGQQNIASLVDDNDINDARIAQQPELAEIIVQPQVNEQSITTGNSSVIQLHNYLVSQGSPMAGSAATFIEVAQKYGINWKLLPAIADTESGLGKVIPINANGTPSYNAFGYGVTGGDYIPFSSWNDAIEKVAAGIVSAYGSQDLTAARMEQTYCPPSYNSDHHWVASVESAMAQM